MMKAKIMRKVKRIVGTSLAMLLLVSTPVMEAQAAGTAGQAAEAEEVVVLEFVEGDREFERTGNPMARTALYNCLITVECSADGMLANFLTCATGTASVIGVKDVKIQKKVWYGWKTVATSDGGEWENKECYSGHILYEGAEKEETYRITCVHYADVNGYNELENEMESFVFTY